jgi:hypothetical protein
MIVLGTLGKISAIFLTVFLIGYLMIAELGSKKIKRALMPFLIVLIILFLIIAVFDVLSKL